MFAIWRVPAPWQPITKKGKGMRMGGGKAAIDHYATPIRPNRIILEIAGKVEYDEVSELISAQNLTVGRFSLKFYILFDRSKNC